MSKLYQLSYSFAVALLGLLVGVLNLRLQLVVGAIAYKSGAGSGTGTRQTASSCEGLHTVAVKKTRTGSNIFIASGQTSFLINIPTHSLPSLECGKDFHRCNILFLHMSARLHIILPSIGGFMWVDYVLAKDETPTVYFQEVTQPCSPTKLYYNNRGDILRIIMTCFNLTAQQDGLGSLYYTDFTLSTVNNRTIFSQRESSSRTLIYALQSVSEAVYADGLIKHGCFIDEEVYVFDQSFPLHTPTEPFRSPEFVDESPLEGCSEYHHVEYSGLDRLIVYCANQRAAVYSMCVNEAKYYDVHLTGIPYPCSSDWNNVLYRRAGKLIVVSTDNNNGTEIDFDHEIVYGKCSGPLSNLLFWGLTQNGTLIKVSLSRREVCVINSTCQDNQICLRPVFSGQGSLHSYFNPTSLSIITVNSTSGERLLDIQLPFYPDMYTLYTESDIEDCGIQYPTTLHTRTQVSTLSPSLNNTSEHFVSQSSSAVVAVIKSVYTLLSLTLIFSLYI